MENKCGSLLQSFLSIYVGQCNHSFEHHRKKNRLTKCMNKLWINLFHLAKCLSQNCRKSDKITAHHHYSNIVIYDTISWCGYVVTTTPAHYFNLTLTILLNAQLHCLYWCRHNPRKSTTLSFFLYNHPFESDHTNALLHNLNKLHHLIKSRPSPARLKHNKQCRVRRLLAT